MQKGWRSPIYNFFQSDVSVGYEGEHLYHFFKCGARVCKTHMGGVRRYQDSKDRNSTANLKQHANRCFGAEAVKNRIDAQAAEASSGSIFTAFARQGQQPVHHSHRTHTSIEARARIVKWVTENNRPMAIIRDCELSELLLAGRPQLSLPSPQTIGRDIKVSFDRCREHIKTLLNEHSGRLHFATDCWTSPNYRAFVAWTVHLHFQGAMLAFLLDIVELPESHTGATLAREFQNMLQSFGLTQKILSFNADNASCNDTQTASLCILDNSFEEENRVRCFNHTMQLSAMTLIRPFNAGMTSDPSLDELGAAALEDVDLGVEDDDEDDDDEGEDVPSSEEEDDVDDGIDEMEQLTDKEKQTLIEDTKEVRGTVSKLRNLAFAIIHSSTLSLPAWKRCCKRLKIQARLIPRDVITRWNSTYDMLVFCLKYKEPIDAITADKVVKLRRYELDPKDWIIVEDLVSILKVRSLSIPNQSS